MPFSAIGRKGDASVEVPMGARVSVLGDYGEFVRVRFFRDAGDKGTECEMSPNDLRKAREEAGQ